MCVNIHTNWMNNVNSFISVQIILLLNELWVRKMFLGAKEDPPRRGRKRGSIWNMMNDWIHLTAPSGVPLHPGKNTGVVNRELLTLLEPLDSYRWSMKGPFLSVGPRDLPFSRAAARSLCPVFLGLLELRIRLPHSLPGSAFQGSSVASVCLPSL